MVVVCSFQQCRPISSFQGLVGLCHWFLATQLVCFTNLMNRFRSMLGVFLYAWWHENDYQSDGFSLFLPFVIHSMRPSWVDNGALRKTKEQFHDQNGDWPWWEDGKDCSEGWRKEKQICFRSTLKSKKQTDGLERRHGTTLVQASKELKMFI